MLELVIVLLAMSLFVIVPFKISQAVIVPSAISVLVTDQSAINTLVILSAGKDTGHDIIVSHAVARITPVTSKAVLGVLLPIPTLPLVLYTLPDNSSH